MRVAPAIAALRDDPVPQRQAQQAIQAAWDAWRTAPAGSRLHQELAEFGAGKGLEQCPALEDLFTGQGGAERLLGSLARNMCAAMKLRPLAHPPFRHGYNGHSSTLLLAQSGRAQLLLQSREPGPRKSDSALFNDALRYEAVVGGRGKGRIARIRGGYDKVRFCDEEVTLEPGGRLAFDCATEILFVDKVETRLVTLRLEKVAADPGPSREFCRRTGKLLHQAAGSLGTSRREMMVALLGRMGRKEAAPVMAEMARTQKDDSLRWQALRECLALDTAEGFATLCAIARDPEDSLSQPAGALRAQLVETHPQLLALEKR